MAENLKGLPHGQIRMLFSVGTAAGLTDGQLLERFATRRDEAAELAFAALVERHGPMVLRVCRGILRDHHEAMDAFQATFLVLARKGGSLWVRDSIGPWLHRVACRAAGRARGAAARRRTVESRAAEMWMNKDHGKDLGDLASAVHEEIDRLPGRYREPVVLCDLEGHTCEEAARHLGCPVGTVGSRLARGRQRLRDRLGRRGLVPGAGSGPLAGAAVPLGLGAHDAISAELVSSTALAAVRFVSTRAALEGVASSLALEILRTMAMNRWWKAASLLLALGASTSGVVTIAARGTAVAETQTAEPPKSAPDAGAFTEVKPGKLVVNVQERGSLESAQVASVFNKVQGQTTIMSILPEGTRVKEGQLVCELDSASLKDRYTLQVEQAKKAESAHGRTRDELEVAELALKEYEEGIYPQEVLAIKGEASLARLAITRAEEQLKRSRDARETLAAALVGQVGGKSPANVEAELDLEDRIAAAEQAIERGRVALAVGQAKHVVLEKYTKEKTLKQLRNEVEKARTVEAAAKAAWQADQSKIASLEKQIGYCRLFAPADGLLVYANDPGRAGGHQIEEGASVRERQMIFSLPDLTKIQVNAKIHESIVDRLRVGLRARIRVDAFADKEFTGVVKDIAPLPDPPTFFNRDIKAYTSHISLDEPIPGLRPGMTAEVDILVSELDNVLSVPVHAVVTYDNKDHVAVKRPDGGVDWREVTLGTTNGKVVEVREGVKAGENVALEPASLLSDEKKQDATFYPIIPPAQTARAKGKSLGISPEVRAKLLSLPVEDRQRLREAWSKERQAILKKAGLTETEIRRYLQLLNNSNAPR